MSATAAVAAGHKMKYSTAVGLNLVCSHLILQILTRCQVIFRTHTKASRHTIGRDGICFANIAI